MDSLTNSKPKSKANNPKTKIRRRRGRRDVDGLKRNGRQTPLSSSWSEEDERKHLKKLQRLCETLKAEGQVLCLSEIRRVVQNGDQAICLSQMLYWFCLGDDRKTRARLKKKGRAEVWMAKTVKEFAKEVGMRPRQARAALDWLTKKKFIEKSPSGFCGRKTTYWRIVPGKIEEEITKQQSGRKTQ